MKNIPRISRLFSLSICVFILFMTSCDEDKNIDPVITTATTGIYVLSEGVFNQNNSTLTYYNLSNATATTDFFTNVNNRGLGDTGNDLQVYGSKLYCVVSGSSQVEVIDPTIGKSIKQLPMFASDNTPRQPRCIAFDKGYAYICSFDGTVGRLDTATLAFDKFITVGLQPDGICVANSKLYVSNSGGLNYPDYDNTVSVINTSTFEKAENIPVGLNPFTIHADQYGDVYVVSRGNYGDVKPSFKVIDSKSDKVKKTFDNLEVLNFMISGDFAYVYNYDYVTKATSFKVLNVKTEEMVSEKFITDDTQITTPYGVGVDPATGDVYIGDAYDFSVTGDVYCFSKEGKLKFKFETGINPRSIVFIPSAK